MPASHPPATLGTARSSKLFLDRLAGRNANRALILSPVALFATHVLRERTAAPQTSSSGGLARMAHIRVVLLSAPWGITVARLLFKCLPQRGLSDDVK